MFHGLTQADGTTYFTDQVVPLLTAGNELKEILTQKWIAFYEYEAIEAYNDYRRVPAFLTLNNPNDYTAQWRICLEVPVSYKRRCFQLSQYTQISISLLIRYGGLAEQRTNFFITSDKEADLNRAASFLCQKELSWKFELSINKPVFNFPELSGYRFIGFCFNKCINLRLT